MLSQLIIPEGLNHTYMTLQVLSTMLFKLRLMIRRHIAIIMKAIAMRLQKADDASSVTIWMVIVVAHGIHEDMHSTVAVLEAEKTQRKFMCTVYTPHHSVETWSTCQSHKGLFMDTYKFRHIAAWVK